MIHHDMSLECLTDSCSTHHLGILICSSQQSRLTIIDQARYHTPSIPELWRHRQVDPCESEAKPGLYNEFKAGQGYIVKPLKKKTAMTIYPLSSLQTDKSLQTITSHCPSQKFTSAKSVQISQERMGNLKWVTNSCACCSFQVQKGHISLHPAFSLSQVHSQ